MTETLTLNSADLMGPTFQFPDYAEKFPEYFESIDVDPLDDMASLEVPTSPLSPVNKIIKDVVATPDRHPSPQPTHFSVPYKNGNGNGHRVLRSATVGYIAPEFKGKKAQMLQGKSRFFSWNIIARMKLDSTS
jgi:glutamate dehydrogenase